MAWQGNSDRRAGLPGNWTAIRRRVLARDRWCQWGSLDTDRAPYGRCPNRSSDADHKGRSDDHSDENLRGLCRGHHASRSSSQGGSASGAARRSRASLRARPAEAHPGRESTE